MVPVKEIHWHAHSNNSVIYNTIYNEKGMPAEAQHSVDK